MKGVSGHIDADEARRYWEGRLTVPDLLRFDEHLASCAACRESLADGERLQAACARVREELASPAGPEHLAYEQLEALTDGRLSPREEAGVERHVRDCAACAAALGSVEAARALVPASVSEAPATAEAAPALHSGDRPGTRRSRGFHLWLAAAAGAAAALAIGWSAARPLWNDLHRERERAEQLEQANRSLQSQATAVRGLRAQIVRLQQKAARADSLSAADRHEAPPAPAANRPGSAARPMPEVRTHLAGSGLRDGVARILIESSGRAVRVEALPPPVREALRRGTVQPPGFVAALVPREGPLLGPGEASSFRVEAPLGTAVLADQPRFRWTARTGATSYVVTVFDDRFNEVAKSPLLAGLEWLPERPLPRGQVLRWQVAAMKDDEELERAPAPPAPEARFSVLDRTSAAALQRAEERYAGSPITLGILFARAGLLDDAERELAAAREANPNSALARRLLESVRAPRHAPGSAGRNAPATGR